MTELDDEAVDRLRRAIGPAELDHARYRFDAVIGVGGMGTVYAGSDRVLERPVAIKVLRGAVAPDHAERLSREARILARLDHPGLVPVHDVGSLADGRGFYVMRLVRGVRLDEHLRVVSSLAERLRLFLRILDPVAYAHAQGVVHRDLKPANIMVGPFGEVLVLDWGIAKVRGESLPPPGLELIDPDGPGATGPGTVLGTRGFMAPEQAAGASAEVDQRADVYGLGAVLGVMMADADRPPPRPLLAIGAKATAASPDVRYPTVGALAADVSRWLDGQPVTAYRESLGERLGRQLGRHRTAVLLIGAYLVVRIVLLVAGRR